MAFLDFKVIKKSVSIEAVLAHYNVQFRRTGERGAIRAPCPLPTHTSKKGWSFGANISKNVWACQSASCQSARDGNRGGNVLDFVAVMESCSVHEAATKLSEWFGLEAPAGADRQPGSKKETSEKTTPLVVEGKSESSEIEINPPLSFALKDITPAHPYLQGRGIDEAIAKKFGIGFFPGRGSMAGRVVIPISNEKGEIIAYAGRSIDDSEPKYKLPTGFRKSIELWNLHRVLELESEQVIIVEGFFGCIYVETNGFANVVAIMGSTLSETQEDVLVNHFREAVLFLDGDEAGRKGNEEIAPRLAKRMFVRIIETPTDKQPDMLTRDELYSLLNHLEPR